MGTARAPQPLEPQGPGRGCCRGQRVPGKGTQGTSRSQRGVMISLRLFEFTVTENLRNSEFRVRGERATSTTYRTGRTRV